MIALTVAQLYRAAWLELTTDDPPPLARVEPTPVHSEKSVQRATHVAKRALTVE